MASHALYPALDPDAIASQSRYVLHRLLRQRLGFRGVVVTDSLEAKAVTERAGPAVAAVRSVRAGADLILTTGAGSHLRVLRALVAEAQRSPAFRKRVEESAARVLALKKDLGLRARAARTAARTLRTCWCGPSCLRFSASAPPPRRRRPSRCSWSATAARVVRDDPALPPDALTTPPPGGERACASTAVAVTSARTVASEVRRVARAGAITPEQRDDYLATYRRARSVAGGLSGQRAQRAARRRARRRVARAPPAADLDADARGVPAAAAERRVLAHARLPEGAAAGAQAVHRRGRARRRARRRSRATRSSSSGIRARGCRSSRSPTSARRTRCGGRARRPAAGARAGADARTDREAHDDAGHPAAAEHGRHRRPGPVCAHPLQPEELRALLDRMVALASERGGFTAWEYFFAFGGGTPPWISGLAQGTAIQALTRGSQLLADPKYVAVARRGLGAFERTPPIGVRARSTSGTGRHYLIYSFATGLRVLNGFLQSLVGLQRLRRRDRRPARAPPVPRRRPRRAARDPRATTPARGRCTRWAATSPTSGTTGSCATSSSRCASAPRRAATARRPSASTATCTSARGSASPASARVRVGAEANIRFTLSKLSCVTVRVRRGAQARARAQARDAARAARAHLRAAAPGPLHGPGPGRRPAQPLHAGRAAADRQAAQGAHVIEVAPEVAEALSHGGPVVALESTIIAHGLPRPDNARIARELEDAVRAARRRAGHDRAARRHGAHRARRRRARRDRHPRRHRQVQRPRPPARGGARRVAARRRSPPPPTSPPAPASACSPPAGSAACTARRRRRGTSRPTSSRCRAPTSASSARA